MWTRWNGPQLERLAESAVNQALMDAANVIGEQADTQVPHDEGFLQDSREIESDPSDPKTVKIGYGGGPGTGRPEVPYAVKWHETQANFQKGRKWKYLSDPLKTVGPRAVLRALRQRLNAAFR